MSPERWQEIQELLLAALERAPDARQPFLTDACADDSELLDKVRALLEAHELAGSFFSDELVSAPPTRAETRDLPGHNRKAPDESTGLAPDERRAYVEWVRAHGDVSPEVRDFLEAFDDASSGRLQLDGPRRADPRINQTVSHFEISERLGGGGMGIVYRARDTRLDRIVALKFLPRHMSGDVEAKTRLLQEARAASALDHVNICTIHEIGETDDGQLYIAMACYAGETLKRKIQQGLLPLEECIDYVLQIARGLAKAHELGIVHRDIKPANVMVTRDGVVKLLDFGLAKATGESLTRDGMLVGTVAYMSPEQTRGHPIDHRTDIWSLGVLLFEMISGRRPFQGTYEQAIIYAILHEEPDVPEGLDPRAAEVLERVASRMLAKQAAARYDDVGHLIRDLEAFRLSISESGAESETRAASRRDVRPERRLLPDGERLQASVAVCRLDGYADLVERFAPDELERLTHEIRDRVTEVVESRGGLVHSFAGDEAVLFFGVPTPEEDDCVRAVRAVRTIQTRLRELVAEARDVNLRMHIGIDTGLIVAQQTVGAERSYRIVGSPLQVAQALASHAKPGEILVGAKSCRLLAASFENESAESLPVAADTDPVSVYRVGNEINRESRFAAHHHEVLTAFTGRQNELDVLHAGFERAIAGEGQLVAVMGEAGLGKSRLVLEFRQPIDNDGITLLHGHCSSSGPLVLFEPFLEAMHQHLGIDRQDIRSEAEERIVQRILEIDPELRPYVPLYLQLLSMQSDAHPLPPHVEVKHIRAKMLEALAALFTLSSAHKPLVLLLEDWHWSDEASRELLDSLTDLIPSYPILLVVTYRPEYAPSWGQPAHQTHIRLRRLDALSSTAMVKSILSAEQVEESISELLYERTGGTPFFLEEICHALREEGTLQVQAGSVTLARSVEKSQLPTTVQAVIRTRLHRLDSEHRSVLSLAAVVGREFTQDILRHIIDDHAGLDASLNALQSAGLIQKMRIVPDPAYRFKHILTQEAAYDSLLQHQRRRMHGLVGRAVEERFADGLEEHADVLAHHFAAAEEWSKAIRYGREAIKQAYQLGHFEEALAFSERARMLIQHLPDGAETERLLVDVAMREERVLDMLGWRDRQEAAIDELFSLLAESDDPNTLAEIYVRRGDLYTLMARFEEAEEALNVALRLSRERAHVPGERKALRSLGFLRWHQNRHEEALAINEELIALDRRLDDHMALVMDLSNQLNILRRLQDFDRGLTYAEELLGLIDKIGDETRTLAVLATASEIFRGLGKLDDAKSYIERALELAERSIELADREKLFGQASFARVVKAQILFEEGRFEESIQAYRELIAVCGSRWSSDGSRTLPSHTLDPSPGSVTPSSPYWLAGPQRVLGSILSALGRHEESLPHFEEAAKLYAMLKDQEAEADVRTQLAEVHERGQQYAHAGAEWEHVRDLCDDIGDAAGACRALHGIARMARQSGDSDLAIESLRAALTLAPDLDDDAREGALRNALAILEWERGAYDEALDHYEHARRIYEDRDEPANLGLVLNSIGVTLHKLDRTEEAVQSLEDAVETHRRTGERQLEAHALAALGDVYFETDRPADALPLYGASLQLRWDLEDRQGEGWMLQRLAQVYAAQGAAGRARTSTAKAVEIGEELEDEELLKACGRLDL